MFAHALRPVRMIGLRVFGVMMIVIVIMMVMTVAVIVVVMMCLIEPTGPGAEIVT